MESFTKTAKRERRLMTLNRRKGAGVRLGRYSYESAQPSLRTHDHHGAIEICFLARGLQTYQVQGRRYRLRGGDVFITFPNERHSTGGLPEEKGVLYWMILDVSDDGEGLLGFSARESRALLKSLLSIKTRHFRGSWKMKDHLDAITVLHGQKRRPLNAMGIAIHAGAFLLEVIACSRSPGSRSQDQVLQSLLQYIGNHLGQPMSVPSLAAKTGLSVPRFQARFKQEIGMPPGEYVLRARIDEAKRRLERGSDSMTDIAYDLGFASSQYFATVFKRFHGRSPSDYRELGKLRGPGRRVRQ